MSHPQSSALQWDRKWLEKGAHSEFHQSFGGIFILLLPWSIWRPHPSISQQRETEEK